MPTKLQHNKLKCNSKCHLSDTGLRRLFRRYAPAHASDRNLRMVFKMAFLNCTRCIVNISNGNFASMKSNTLRAIAPFGLLFVLFNIANINVANALSITVDGGTSTTKSFQLIPGSSNTSGNVAISVASSDAAGGYTLSMTGPNAAKTLIGANASNVLNPIASTTWTNPSSFGDNTWGILPSKLCTGSTADTCSNNTTYQPAPGTDTQIVDITTSANATATTYALAFGAKVSDIKTPDTYTGTITMTLTANATPYSIGFIDATNNMPDTIHGSTTNASVTLPTNIPTKDGYTFIGWCSVRTTDSTCSGTTYQPGGTYTLSNGAMTNLYAMWEAPEPPADPVISRVDYNTFSFSSDDATAYFIKVDDDTTPSASASGWTTSTTYDITQDAEHTYYVWGKDSGGSVSSASEVESFEVSRSNTSWYGTLYTKYDYDGSTGISFSDTIYVVNGTPIWAQGVQENGLYNNTAYLHFTGFDTAAVYCSKVTIIDNILQTTQILLDQDSSGVVSRQQSSQFILAADEPCKTLPETIITK